MSINMLGLNNLSGLGGAGDDVQKNYALSFDGVNDGLDITQTSGLPIVTTSGFSIFMRVYLPSDSGVDKRFFGESRTSTQLPSYHIMVGAVDNSKIRFWTRNDGGSVLKLQEGAAGVLKIDQWVTLGWTDLNGTVKAYVNGVQVDGTTFNYGPTGTRTFDTTTLAHTFRNGSREGHLKCKIDYCKLYSDVLTSGEITTLHNGGHVSDNIILNLNMNNNVVDQSGNGNNGSFVDSPVYEIV